MVGQERIGSASKRWRKAYNEYGELGLTDTRKTSSGRPSSQELTLEKQLSRKDAEIAYLKAFNYRGYKKGSRSIKMVLEKEFNIIYNRKRIQRMIRKYGVKCPIRKANPYRRMMKATR